MRHCDLRLLAVTLWAPPGIPASVSLTVWQIKLPYLCTCFFSQAASSFVCANPRTWTVSQVWVYSTSRKQKSSSTLFPYLWRSEGLVQRQHRLLETFPKLWFRIIIYAQTVYSSLRWFLVFLLLIKKTKNKASKNQKRLHAIWTSLLFAFSHQEHASTGFTNLVWPLFVWVSDFISNQRIVHLLLI